MFKISLAKYVRYFYDFYITSRNNNLEFTNGTILRVYNFYLINFFRI